MFSALPYAWLLPCMPRHTTLFFASTSLFTNLVILLLSQWSHTHAGKHTVGHIHTRVCKQPLVQCTRIQGALIVAMFSRSNALPSATTPAWKRAHISVLLVQWCPTWGMGHYAPCLTREVEGSNPIRRYEVFFAKNDDTHLGSYHKESHMLTNYSWFASRITIYIDAATTALYIFSVSPVSVQFIVKSSPAVRNACIYNYRRPSWLTITPSKQSQSYHQSLTTKSFTYWLPHVATRMLLPCCMRFPVALIRLHAVICWCKLHTTTWMNPPPQ